MRAGRPLVYEDSQRNGGLTEFPGTLSRISHPLPAAAADSGLFMALRSVGV